MFADKKINVFFKLYAVIVILLWEITALKCLLSLSPIGGAVQNIDRSFCLLTHLFIHAFSYLNMFFKQIHV